MINTSRNENAGQKGKTGSDPDEDDNDGDDNSTYDDDNDAKYGDD